MTDRPPFAPVPTELDFPKYERRILDFWKDAQIFEKSKTHRGEDAPRYVFYEGPPTANGIPHNGHVLTRVVKDLFPRYHAMCGERVLRKGGWDTHGLPVEVEVEKELRIHGKEAILEYGVRPFAARCIESVFRYTSEWEQLTERIGFWVGLDDAYVTYHKSYVESVWWALSELFNRGLLYEGHKVVWWWPQGGTAVSAAEVGLGGYKTVDDPSAYALCPLVDEPDTALVVWTTTPWTLPSNCYAAVKVDTTYDVVEIGAKRDGKRKSDIDLSRLAVKRFIIASALREEVAKKVGHDLDVVRTVSGADLVGQRYRPLFDFYSATLGDTCMPLKAGGEAAMYWRVLAEDFVTLDSGTGIVHIAPAFGEDDYEAHKRQLATYVTPQAVDLLCAIEPTGKFKSDVPSYAGMWVKDADPNILRDLEESGRLLHREMYRHEYPFCWRADQDPLIQMARPGWFIRTTAEIDVAKANNQAVNWLPPHIKDGRFGDFLENNVDWALSRDRFWGTPLNVWICSADPAHRHAPASVDAIKALNPDAFAHWDKAKAADPDLNENLMIHKPWVDDVVFPCPDCGAEMRRVTGVIDCWFDSGCMPFAQWGFPHQPGSTEKFDDAFPADFISEGLDQTRGWFYSLLMVSSLLFSKDNQKRYGLSRVRELPHPYKTCIALGLVCDREGRKESKSKGNYTSPDIILDRVSMDFGVLDAAFGLEAKPGEIHIARDDLEGMDLKDGAAVAVYRPDAPDKRVHAVVRAHKKLPRRVAIVSVDERATLGLTEVSTGLNTAVKEVLGVPTDQRITIEDETTPAPGADAFRWFFFASSPPWTNTRHSLRNVRTFQKDFLVKLRNVYSFFTIYANIDGFRPCDAKPRPVDERTRLDRWMLSELNITIRDVRKSLDDYMAYDAATRIVALVEALSNWYVRRSRARFWGHGLPQDKVDAYATLRQCLAEIALLAAPFIPFFTEELYQNVVVRAGLEGAQESVHLADFPEPDAAVIDEALAEEMAAAREIVSLGLSVRTASKLKVRQPLSAADVVFNDDGVMQRLDPYRAIIAEELNVLAVNFLPAGHEDAGVQYQIKANFRALGPRLGKRVQAVKKALGSASASELHAELTRSGKMTVDVDGEGLELSGEEVDISVTASEGLAAQTGDVGVVVLHTVLDDALIDEGLLREMISRVQGLRKERSFDFADRIELRIAGSERLVRIAKDRVEKLQSECLATSVTFDAKPGDKEMEFDGESLTIGVDRVG